MSFVYPYLNDYMARFSNEKNKKLFLTWFLKLKEFLRSQNITKFSEISRIHIDRYFQELNKQQLRASSKQKIFQVLNFYLKWLFDYDYIKEKIYLPECPKFSDYISDAVKKRIQKPIPTYQEVVNLLEYARQVDRQDKRMYIMFALLAPNGMRISELVSIQLKMLNIENRTIITGLDENASKTGICYYFIPVKLIPDLREYINDIKKFYKDPIYLFPSRSRTEHDHYYTQNAGKVLKKYQEILMRKNLMRDCLINPHIFRDLLNELRLEMKCPTAIQEILLNHIPTGTNAQFYTKQLTRNIEKRKEYWDLYTPDFLTFL